MRNTAPVSRRPSLKLAVLVGASALVAALAACAASPVDDDLGAPASDTSKAEPEGESARLPPSNPPAQPPADAGSDAKTASKDSGTTPKDASTPPPDAGNTGTGGSCDANDPLFVVKALAEINKSTPRTCGLLGGSCKASECCFDAYGVCVDL